MSPTPPNAIVGTYPVDLRGILFAEAERRSFPAVRLSRQGEHVTAGRESWQAFASNAFAADVADALATLERTTP